MAEQLEMARPAQRPGTSASISQVTLSPDSVFQLSDVLSHVTLTSSCGCQRNVTEHSSSKKKRLYREFLRYWFPLLVSIAAAVFAILSLFASWKALSAANKANSWAYLSYNSSLVQIRLSIMQLCVDKPELYSETCDLVHTWNYLPSVYNIYHPDGMQSVPIVPSPVHHRLSETTVAVTCFAVVVGAVPLIAVALLATGQIRGKANRDGNGNG
jgi:hypothetical protein